MPMGAPRGGLLRLRLATGLTGLVALSGFLAVLPPTRSAAQEHLADLPLFREACQALADERFETAAAGFRDCWALLEEGEVDGPEGNFVAARLLESLVRNGAGAAATSWLAANEAFQASPESSYWIALAYESEGRFSEAAEHYQRHLAATPEAPSSVRINRSICLARSGQPEAAFDLVEDLVPASPAESLRLAQLAASASRDAIAFALLPGTGPAVANANADVDADPSLSLAATRLRVFLLARRGDRAGALDSLYRLVDEATDVPSAQRALLLLEVFLDGEKPEGLDRRFAAWEGDASFPGREVALLVRHDLLDEEPARSEALSAIATSHPDPGLRGEARLRLGEAPPEGDLPAALRERWQFSFAADAFEAGDFEAASRLFAAAAESESGESAGRDLYNAALAALRHDDAAAFERHERDLEARYPRSRRLADLRYLGGLYLASRGAPSAFERLKSFVQTQPGHPALLDAKLALAEIHLNQAPARPREAREIFDSLRNEALSLKQSERLDYASVWLERIEGNGPELLRRAEEFVQDWPNSSYLGEVLMMLAMEFYTRRSFEPAARAFRRVSEQFPDSPHAGTARFFEAKASPATDETLAKWRRLIDEKGPMANEASHELGLLLLSLDRFEESRNELSRLLERLPAEAPLRLAAMADLSHVDYLDALASDKDATKLNRAAEGFAAVSRIAHAPALWRFNAAVRRGKCLEALGKSSVALEIYRSIVAESRAASESSAVLPPEETEWVFRAGFSAIKILNEAKDWPAAIAVADALAGKSGPRAIEAKRLAERLRLQHWVWE